MLPVLGVAASLALTAAPDRATDLREEARALVLVQQTLDWYTKTQGETSVQAETYKGHGRLFSRESVARVAQVLRASTLPPDERRALEFFKAYLAGEYLSQRTSLFDDQAQNAALKASVRLPWSREPVPYKELDILSANEKDAARRQEIEKARAGVWRDVLNPILERKEATAQRLARELGYPSYVALSEESRRVQLRAFMVEGHRFLQATDGLFRQLLAEVSQRELGLPVAQVRRSDLNRLFKGPRLERFFPAELTVPAFKAFLGGMGIDFKTVAGTEIRVDDSNNPLKEFRAECWGVRVPSDIRINLKPNPGLDNVGTFFHEGGHAIHFANTTTPIWEFHQLGPNTFTESVGELFRYSWADPVWLKRYRDFVQGYNASAKRSVPVMEEQDVRDLVRLGLFTQLYYLRRYAYAKLVYESVLHGGSPALWRGVYERPTTDPMQVYREVFSTAYGFPLTEEDALRFRTDVDDTFYSVDYARSFALAHLMHEGMRGKFGPDWYGSREAGQLLRTLVANGQKPQPDEVAAVFGVPFDLRPAETRIRRLAAETEAH
jgi:hypothetical protein